MRFHGMKVTRVIQYWDKDGSDRQYKLLPAKKVTELDRPYNVQGYNVSKPQMDGKIFVRKYSVAIMVLCMGIYQGPGVFSGHGAKIEAVR